MQESVYAPPKADLSQFGDAASDGDNAFYVVAIRKFTLLFFLTLGIYQLYWTYKNWSAYKDRCRYANAEGKDIWPIPRAIFSVFFTHSLFHKVDDYATEKERTLSWSVDSHATGLVGLLIISGVCERLSSKSIGSPYTDLAWLVMLVPLYFGYRHAQQYVNTACGDPTGISNSELTGANWAWMVVGGLFCILAMIGLFLPEVSA